MGTGRKNCNFTVEELTAGSDEKHSASPPGIEPRVLRILVARSNHWATKPQRELGVKSRLSPNARAALFFRLIRLLVLCRSWKRREFDYVHSCVASTTSLKTTHSRMHRDTQTSCCMLHLSLYSLFLSYEDFFPHVLWLCATEEMITICNSSPILRKSAVNTSGRKTFYFFSNSVGRQTVRQKQELLKKWDDMDFAKLDPQSSFAFICFFLSN